jgi:diadenosine tetraphosphatase ApaH/serine/threonine PP2A family protein phosphatase
VLAKRDEKIIISGHTHLPFIGKFKDKIIFNTGSVGMSFDGDNRASYGIINFTNLGPKCEIRRVTYPIDETLALAEDRDFPGLKEYKRIISEAIIK